LSAAAWPYREVSTPGQQKEHRITVGKGGLSMSRRISGGAFLGLVAIIIFTVSGSFAADMKASKIDGRSLLPVRADSGIADPGQPGPYFAGKQITWVKNRIRTQFENRRLVVSYPALEEGFGAAPDAGCAPWPIVVVCHGWGGPPEVYTWITGHLASHGYFVANIDYYNFTSQELMLSDVTAAVDWVEEQQSDQDSPYSGLLDLRRMSVSGHSMGGGLALWLLESDHRIKAACPMAPYDLLGELYTIAEDIREPVLLIGGALDTVAPPDEMQWPVYEIVPAPKRVIIFNRAEHRTFIDKIIPTQDEIAVQMQTKREMVSFLGYHLKDERAYRSLLYGGAGIIAPGTDIARDSGEIIDYVLRASSRMVAPGEQVDVSLSVKNNSPAAVILDGAFFAEFPTGARVELGGFTDHGIFAGEETVIEMTITAPGAPSSGALVFEADSKLDRFDWLPFDVVNE